MIRVWFGLVLVIALGNFESVWIESDTLKGALSYTCKHGGKILDFDKL